jgi:hypothetical protein
MNSMIARIVLATMISLLAVGQLSAQQPAGPAGMGGWGPRMSYARMYDPKTIETLAGEVVSVDKFIPSRGMSQGVHLALKTGTETISIHLGPAWYIDNQEVKIAAGDKIEIKGSRISFDGKPAVIAAEVRKGDDVLTLRDQSGVPAWSGWKRRSAALQ